MPRSADGRWTAICKMCGTSYQQRKPDQEYCSKACSNQIPKARHVGPRDPSVVLVCPACGKQFEARRSDKRACSRACYSRLPDRQSAQRLADAKPERKQRKNELRRGKPITAATNRRNQMVRYGITPEQHDEMLRRQSGLCAICGAPPAGGIRAASRLHIDHDHVTGRVRDLLCNSCNNGLGRFKDDPALLRAAADYIERHRLTTSDPG